MLKRKLSPSPASSDRSHLPSIYDGDPIWSKRKRLFRPKNTNTNKVWTPPAQRDMSELLEFVLQHEDAFKK